MDKLAPSGGAPRAPDAPGREPTGAAQVPAAPLLDRVMRQVQEALRAGSIHPSRCVVLLPYAQLLRHARGAWARVSPDGFCPRFETTQNWAQALGDPGVFEPGPLDLCMDPARDLLLAQSLLEQAGLGRHRRVLAPRLVEAAMSLAPLAAAVPPSERDQWAARTRPVVGMGLDAPALSLEQAVARIALEWAATSRYVTDALMEDAALADLDRLIVLRGFQPDPLADALVQRLAERAQTLAMAVAPAQDPPPPTADTPHGGIHLHDCRDPEDEASRAAACVLRHLGAGRRPVALAATDRALTRRIRALLAAQGVRLRDETGWKLSTTRAAARVMAVLRAARADASSDMVLDALKQALACDGVVVQALESALRRAGVRDWSGAAACVRERDAPGDAQRQARREALLALIESVDARRVALQRTRPLSEWLRALRDDLAQTGQWALLADDEAGQAVLAALHMDDEPDEGRSGDDLAGLPHAQRRMTLAELTAWVTDVLEAHSFRPRHPRDEQVVVLPFAQMLGQPFAAAVLPGCDEDNLPAAPEPTGPWTEHQRLALGLPGRGDLQAAQRSAWLAALSFPSVDVLWRRADAAGEPVMASPLVQALALSGRAAPGADARIGQRLTARPTLPSRPQSAGLMPGSISASAYEDLRRCPYRFFAIRLLGLQEAEELDTERDKRDFGSWVHAVLGAFHQSLEQRPLPDIDQRRARLDECAREQARAAGLDDSDFLPFQAAWPRVREAYLAWLAAHEARGARFVEAEAWREVSLELPLEQPSGGAASAAITLTGRLDRIDRLADGSLLVMDYKTEADQATRERLKEPTEDTQLAFYAALLPDADLRAGYVNLGEKEVRLYEMPDMPALRDGLRQSIARDLAAIGAGSALPALGEGSACEYCQARGLCRKDHWS